MEQQQQEAVCPVEVALSIVGGKWKLQIIYCLLSGTKRFGQLRRLIPRTTQQMLTMQLRELEQAGILHRQVYAQGPPKVGCSPTGLGRSLAAIVHQNHARGMWDCEQNSIGY